MIVKIEEQIPDKTKTHSSKLVKPIQKEELDALEYIDHMCHNTHRDTILGKYVIKISRFDSGTPEEWIIFVNLVQKNHVGQNANIGPLMYKCMD